MGAHFRNNLTAVPTVRISVGRRGVSTTIGWSGSNLTAGQDATGSPSVGSLRRIGNPNFDGPLPTDPHLIPGTQKQYGSGDVSEMTSLGLGGFKSLLIATGQRQREIVAEIRKARWQQRLAWTAHAVGWVTLVSAAVKPVRTRSQNALTVCRSDIATLRQNLEATRISVDFDMDSEVAEPHRRMQAAFDRMVRCQRRWSLVTEQKINRVKARSFAGTVINRVPVEIHRMADKLVDTKQAPLAFNTLGAKSTAYFYPGFLLIVSTDRSDFALVDLRELSVAATNVNFTESDPAPADSQMTGTTWAKANKNGSRDRRFAHNRELPIMRYGELHLTSPGGLNEAYMFSRADSCQDFAVATAELTRILASGDAGRRIGNQSRITGNR